MLSRKEEPAPFLRSLAVQLGDVASFIFIANPSPALLSRFQDPHVPNIVLLLPQAGQLSQTAMPPSVRTPPARLPDTLPATACMLTCAVPACLVFLWW